MKQKTKKLIGELITIPAGSFVMGSDKYSDEKPKHTVNVRGFRLMKTPVTFDHYDAFARATGCELPDDRGWGRGTRPVINVSWEDAQKFAQWVSEQTGTRVRLPSEAEWEYAARARTTTDYWWGNYAYDKYAHYGQISGTAPVGSYPANPWGLYDMNGNVFEWIQDYWHDSYVGAPSDGSAWETLESICSPCRVARGGSWYFDAFFLPSATRSRVTPVCRDSFLGFRLAQDL